MLQKNKEHFITNNRYIEVYNRDIYISI